MVCHSCPHGGCCCCCVCRIQKIVSLSERSLSLKQFLNISGLLHQFPAHRTSLIPCCTHPDHDTRFLTRHVRSFHVQALMHASARFFLSSSLVVCFSVARQWNGSNFCLRQIILALILIPHVVSSCKNHNLIACTSS